jgi:hypothetical protein
LHNSGSNGLVRWAAKYRARSYIKLAAVAWACHRRTIKLALRERTPHMSAFVIKGMQLSLSISNTHLCARDIKDAHLILSNILCASYSYKHDLPPVLVE